MMFGRLLSLFGAKDREQYMRASVGLLEGAGSLGGKPKQFRDYEAIESLCGWVAAAQRLRSNAVAGQTLRLYMREEPGRRSLWRTRAVPDRTKRYMRGELQGMQGVLMPGPTSHAKVMELGDDFVEVVDAHPIKKLLADPNRWAGGFSQAWLRAAYQDLVGNAYFHVVKDDEGIPIELWPMMPHWTEVIASRENFIDGYIYGRQGADRVVFPPDEVLRFARPNVADLHYGAGNLMRGWTEYLSDMALTTMDYSWFKNSARPDYLVSVEDQAVGDDQLEELQGRLSKMFGGVRKAGRFAVFGSKVDIKPLQFPPKDMAGREELVEKIAAIMGVPVTLLKANDPNLASARTAFAAWKETEIQPLLSQDEEVLNQQLIPMFGLEGDAWLCYDSPVPEDRDFALRRRESMIRSGQMSINEARMEEGLPEVDGGEEPLVGLGLRRLSDIDTVSVAGSTGGVTIPGATDPRQPRREPPAGEVRDPEEGDGESRSRGFPGPCCDTRRSGPVKQSDLWTKQGRPSEDAGDADDTARAGESEREIQEFAGEVDGIIDSARDEMLQRMESASPDDLDAIADSVSERMEREIQEAASRRLETIAERGIRFGETEARDLGLTVTGELEGDLAARIAREASIELAGEVRAATVSRLREVIGQGIEEGVSMVELRDRIRELDSVFGQFRAENIARTESAHAWSEAHEQSWEPIKDLVYKEWLLAPRACEFCAAASDAFNADQRDVGSVVFPTGTEITGGVTGRVMRLDYRDVKGPPLHPQCRCRLVSRRRSQ